MSLRRQGQGLLELQLYHYQAWSYSQSFLQLVNERRLPNWMNLKKQLINGSNVSEGVSGIKLLLSEHISYCFQVSSGFPMVRLHGHV